MNYKESATLPNECMVCNEQDCYNCDTVGKRWNLSDNDRIHLKEMLKEQAKKRLDKQ